MMERNRCSTNLLRFVLRVGVQVQEMVYLDDGSDSISRQELVTASEQEKTYKNIVSE